ncbi:MAG: hypothetical protein ABL997_04525 [Planctomycetota bacterium]
MLLPSCIASNVVATEDRAVVEKDALADVVWSRATATDFRGLVETIDIRGDAALSLQKVYYWFQSDGRYSGAALVEQDDGVAFQTLSGTWSVENDGLHLDGGEALVAEVAPDLLRIAVPGGTLTLRRTASK